MFISWSGGKESMFAGYKATRAKGAKADYLLNMISGDGTISCSHGISSSLLRIQAEAVDVPILQKRNTGSNYEEKFKEALSFFKEKGIHTGVFGDIDVAEHREWIQRVCDDMGVKAILPLWNSKRKDLIEEFIGAGFKTIVVAVHAPFLGKEWLGRQIDAEFVKDLEALGNVDLCGEKGEYHTFVYDGPIFKNPIKLETGKKVFKNDRWFLEII
ncbi:MAG: diphthine--ammonia ligase [Candidatus Omnitrophota bacterium]